MRNTKELSGAGASGLLGCVCGERCDSAGAGGSLAPVPWLRGTVERGPRVPRRVGAHSGSSELGRLKEPERQAQGH